MFINNRRVLSFTSIRSDYDLLSGLYKTIHSDNTFTLGLIVSGAHLSKTFGFTLRYIEQDGLPIIAKIESLLDADTPESRLKSASILMQCCLHAVVSFKPDVIMFAGDREDAIVAALIGSYLKIPTVHYFGGDHATDGNVDNPVRHATSKLSSVHFVTHEQHKKRLLKIGESADRIFVIGNPALDRYRQVLQIVKSTLLESFNRLHWQDYCVVIYHPILGNEDHAGLIFERILISLMDMGIKAFVSYPNTDAGYHRIIEIINKYNKSTNLYFYQNLPRDLFINLMRHASFLIGNSSAGILEAPIIPLGVVNVGNRQHGRLSGDNVIFTGETESEIRQGIKIVISPQFKETLKSMISPYGDGNSVERAFNLIKSLDFTKYLYKREDPLTL